ncbi:MAG: endonuclease [Bacteroidetes bacterium]|nr:endonuclease [Bacteroidota bacterium]
MTRLANCIILLFFTSAFLFQDVYAQIPTGYYNSIEGKEGEELRIELHKIIRGHHRRVYSQLWNDFYSTDRKPNGKVWCMYSDVPYPGQPAYEFTFFDDQQGTGGASAEGQVYNREHSWPTSWWGGGSSTTDTMYTDLFHIHPADAYINTMRSNWPYGEVCAPTVTTTNGSKRGPNCYEFEGGYTSTAFEPIDAYKGDLARNYFYMVTRYRHRISNWSSPMIQGNTLAPWALDMLMKWHILDPVSPKEINRNNAVYAIQGNRNPFIDHPELACKIWGGNCSFAPIISYAKTIPETPEAFDEIDIEAYIYDDGQIIETIVIWGYNENELNNEIALVYTSNSIFKTTQPIPKQQNLSKLFFRIIATDDEGNESQSSLYEFTIGKPLGGGMEPFDKLNIAGVDYINGNFTGENNIVWNFVHSRNQQTYAISGKGLMFRDPQQSRIYSEPIPHGIQNFSVKMRKAFANNQPRQIELFINGTKKATTKSFGAFEGDCDSIHVFEVKNLNIQGNVIIELRLSNPANNEFNQMVIDDITWTEYAPRIILQKEKMGCFDNTPLNQYSEIKEYGIIGMFLQTHLVIESQPPFEISADGQNFSFFTFFTPDDDFDIHTLYVRFKPVSNVYYEGEITHYSGDINAILDACGYGGNVNILEQQNQENKPNIFYQNNSIMVAWEEMPNSEFIVDIYNISGQKLLSQKCPPQIKTQIPIKFNTKIIVVVVSTMQNRHVKKIILS